MHSERRSVFLTSRIDLLDDVFIYSNFIPCEYPSCHPASHSAIFIGLTIGEQSIILLDDESSIASPAAMPFWNPSSYAWSSAMTIFVGISNIKESINKMFISKLRWNRRLLYCVPVVIFGAFWHICSKLNSSTMNTRWNAVLYVTSISCILFLRRYYKSNDEFCHSLTGRSYSSYFCYLFVMTLLPRKQIWIYLVPIDCEITACRYKDSCMLTSTTGGHGASPANACWPRSRTPYFHESTPPQVSSDMNNR